MKKAALLLLIALFARPTHALVEHESANKAALSALTIKEARLYEELHLTLSEPKLYLERKSNSLGISSGEIQTLRYIMLKESRNCTQLDNPVSTASGCFQIIKGTWLSNSTYPWEERYDHVKNIDTALRIYQTRGTQPWGI